MSFIKRLVWDETNVTHIAKHGVSPEEAEEVCQSEPVVQIGKKGRLLVYGLTKLGRMVTVVLDSEPEEGVYYPVTARPTSKKEREIYRKEKEVDKNDKNK